MFREIIQKEVDRRSWSAYRLGKESGVPIRTVQAYLSGTCDLSGELIAVLCKTLGLELRSTKKGGQ